MTRANEKKVLTLSFLGVITLIILVIGATYAYFAAQGGGTENINVNANTATTDNLSFQVGEPISLTANQEDFGSGMGNKSGSTYARAILTANNATNNATRNYYIYLNITNNNFEYTTADEQAEILLKVTAPDDIEVTNIPELTQKTSGSGDNEVTGFDITTQTGLITIADNYEIVSNGTVAQEWLVEITFVNLNNDQNANTGKSFSASLIISEKPLLGNFANYITNKIYTGVDGENGLYYHDGLGSYTNASQEAGDNSYRYAGANPNNYVCFGSDEETCPADNLYRIIGVFDNQVKIVKNVPLNPIQWDINDSNNWQNASLNLEILNGSFITSFSSKWSDKISNSSWKIAGNNWANLGTSVVKNTYTNEIVSPLENTIYKSKIGLMYVSDYGYASSPENWQTVLYNYNLDSNINNNWLYQEIYEWLLTPNLDSYNQILAIANNGSVNHYNSAGTGCSARPTFYLNSDVFLSRGTGTQTDPYRIAL